ncbi:MULTISPECIES: hypothetical protein [unclassified Luteibacter]|uniref:hypothetical protein n=1 Tax=Luteibacter sp. PvP019 TaxID=3156436 RepID=UPI0033984A2F
MTFMWTNHDFRVRAAGATGDLAARFTGAEPGLIDRMEDFLADPSPVVRAVVASRLPVAYATGPARMWAMADRLIRQEGDPHVIALVASSALRVAGIDTDACVALLAPLATGPRTPDGVSSESPLADVLGSGAASLYIGQDNVVAKAWVATWTADLASYGSELTAFANALREPLFWRYGPGAGKESADGCDRAQDAARLVLTAAVEASTSAHEKVARLAGAPAAPETVAIYRTAERLIGCVVNQLYFGSGAYEKTVHEHQQLADPKERGRFLIDYKTELHLAAQSHEPNTLHYLLELYAFLIPGDPVGVFEAIHGLLTGRGREEGYHFESLGAAVVVRIIRRYIADYRSIFDDGPRQARLVEVLRIFGETGWPDALALLYELPDLLR